MLDVPWLLDSLTRFRGPECYSGCGRRLNQTRATIAKEDRWVSESVRIRQHIRD
jgi:hypothetical protein